MKIRVVCPDCGHRHTITHKAVRGSVAGVRVNRVTGKQFEYTLNLPGSMVEYDRYYTIGQQMLVAGGVGIVGGTLLGNFASIPWQGSNDYIVAQIIGSCAGLGLLAGWSFLAKERALQLGRILPDAVSRYLELQRGTRPPEAVELTMDHRYRDGHSEAGRTIEYFGTLPVDVGRFGQWAVAILGTTDLPGESLAIKQWTGSKGLFSRDEYEALLTMLRGSRAVINQPGKGHLLTGGGRRALRQHLKRYPPAPLGSVQSA